MPAFMTTSLLLRSGLLLASLNACSSPPENAAAAFARGNVLLARGRYEPALAAYRQLERRGVQRAELYCNAGNACYRAGRTGWAVYYYEKGLQQAPADAQLVANRRAALEKAGLPDPPAAFTADPRRWALVADICAKSAVGALVLSGLLLLLAGFSRRADRRVRLVVGCRFGLLSAGAVLLGATVLLWSSQCQAAIVVASAAGRSGPGAAARAVFTTRAGEKVVIRNRYRSWLKVSRASGEAGWLPGSTLGVLGAKVVW